MLVAAAVVLILAVVVFCNPMLAWSSYRKTPEWVEARIRPLSADQRQEMKLVEDIAGRIIGSH